MAENIPLSLLEAERDNQQMKKAEKQLVGYVFDGNTLIAEYRVIENGKTSKIQQSESSKREINNFCLEHNVRIYDFSTKSYFGARQ